jgi:protein arginine kinase
VSATIEDILRNSSPGWMAGTGADADVVISSRIRLARNLEGYRFPALAGKDDLIKVRESVDKACAAINERGGWGRFQFVTIDDLSELDRQVLVEKHLISPQHAEEPVGRALMISEDEVFAVMVNEEDHLRIQSLFSGLHLDQAWVATTGLDDALEASLDYAFCSRRGYLTACPTNVGTGLRASVMMHLPALVMAKTAGGIFTAASKVGMVVRGLYGEGTEALGNIFQLSNQITLGQSETDIISNLQGIARQIAEQERQARIVFRRDMKDQVEDRVFRSYGILQNARILPSDEAMRRWSEVRLGYDLKLIADLDARALNNLIVVTRPGFIQKMAGRSLSPFERDLQRAALVRRVLSRIA